MRDDRGRSVVALTLVGLLVVAAAAVGAVPSGDGPPDGETLVEQVETRYASAESVVGEATITATNGSASVTGTVSFALGEDDRARLAVNRSGHRHVLATNGTVAWAYNESSGRLVVRELPESGENGTWTAGAARNDTHPAWNGTWVVNHSAWNGSSTIEGVNVTRYVEENVTAERLRTETVDGVETDVVRVRHADAAGNVTLWITRDRHSVARLRATRGEAQTTVSFEDQRFNVSVHDSEFRPPTDAATVTRFSYERYEEFDALDDATEVDLRGPGGDYEFERALVTTRSGRQLIASEYADGNQTVTVLTGTGSLPVPANGSVVTVAGENATLVETRRGTAVVWEDDDHTGAVVADLPREELLSVADRVRSS